MHLVYIHGNGASATSFNFIRSQFPGYPETMLEYTSSDGFYPNLDAMGQALDGLDQLFFIAHSLGGIYALHLANSLGDRVLGAVTLSTPYGGSEAAEIVKYMIPFNRVIREIGPSSAPISEANSFSIEHPWTNVVTLDGHSPLMSVANDGVVTRDSMRFRSDIDLVEVLSSHYEVVQSVDAVAVIREAIESADSRSPQNGLQFTMHY